jgi:hypothetical protein
MSNEKREEGREGGGKKGGGELGNKLTPNT